MLKINIVKGKNYTTSLILKGFKVKDIFKLNNQDYYDQEEYERMITYETILTELGDLEYYEYLHEIENRTTKGENINEVLLSVVCRNQTMLSILGYHKRTLKYYITKDFFDLFK